MKYERLIEIVEKIVTEMKGKEQRAWSTLI